MADATPEELAELGVTVGVISETEPQRVGFKEISDLPNEPKTDVLIELETGEKLRERMTRLPVEEGYSFSFSHALVDDDLAVAKNSDDSFKIVPPAARHEFILSGLDAGNMTADQIKDAVKVAREVGASKAKCYFAGMDEMASIFADRLD